MKCQKMIALFLLLCGFVAGLAAQVNVQIRVRADSTEGPFRPIHNWFGYDEPNYTYMKHGRKLLAELSASSPAPVYIRAHNLFTSGDGQPALKWGSTNVYTEDPSGRPVYDWTILDRILDTYRETKTRPMFEIGFMPEALSVKPQPYRHTWPKGGITAGWSYPPRDYRKWENLVYEVLRHSVERYGKANVETWYWEVWNEPDIGYWKGTPEEYYKLYDFAAAGVKRALPSAKFGGPGTTGPASPRAAEFLRGFLDHCARGDNHATGQRGAPLDYISFHAKGRPRVVEGRVQMGISKHLEDVAKGLEIVSSFPQFRKLPIILSESDPEGCAACSARVYPQNAYRNGTLYPCYTAAVLNGIVQLADRYRSNIEGVLTWAFEFEDQPYFDGFRTLATNGIAKPVLNVFRMLGLMGGNRVSVTSTGSAGIDQLLRAGVKDNPEVSALATRSGNTVSVLVWHYHDDDVPGPDAAIDLTVEGVSPAVQRALVRHYRIDEQHSNAYAAWKRMSSPQELSPELRARLEAAGQLQLLASPEWVWNDSGKVRLQFTLPRRGVSLLQLTW